MIKNNSKVQHIIDYLRRLQANNNREWFNGHKAEYLECKAKFDDFTEKLIAGIREFDDSIGNLTAKDCTYRIYRDTRFSQDKTPYKTHFGCFIVPGGKKSGYAGYYLQVGANETGYPGGCMLATGDYCCDPKVLKILREDILADDDNAFTDAIKEAKGFDIDRSFSLKRVPNGYPADHPMSEYLKLKAFCLISEPGTDYMLSDDVLAHSIADFRRTMPFLRFINRAITYVREEQI